MKRSTVCGALVLAALGLYAGPASTQGSELPRAVTVTTGTTSFVGRLGGSRSYIGISVRGNHVIAYVCNGDARRKRSQTVSEWFRGAVRGQRIRLDSRRGGRLSARIVGDRVVGTVRLSSGRTLSFVARTARGRARFLWGAAPFTRTGKLIAGWIRLADRSERGTFRDSNFICQRMAAELKVRVQTAIDEPLADNRRAAAELLGRYLDECL